MKVTVTGYGDSLLFIANGRALRAVETIGRHLGGLRWLDQFEAALGRSVQAGKEDPRLKVISKLSPKLTPKLQRRQKMMFRGVDDDKQSRYGAVV